jgi:hypothetical protein
MRDQSTLAGPMTIKVRLTKQGERRVLNGKAGTVYPVDNFTQGVGAYLVAHVRDDKANIWSLGEGDWECVTLREYK